MESSDNDDNNNNNNDDIESESESETIVYDDDDEGKEIKSKVNNILLIGLDHDGKEDYFYFVLLISAGSALTQQFVFHEAKSPYSLFFYSKKFCAMKIFDKFNNRGLGDHNRKNFFDIFRG